MVTKYHFLMPFSGEVWFPDLDLILIFLISKNYENLISWSPLFFKSRNPDLQILISWSRPDLERINGQLNKGKKSSNLMKSIREKIILLQYVHEFLKLLGKRLCLFDMTSLQKDYTCTILHLWNLFMNFLSNNQNYTK